MSSSSNTASASGWEELHGFSTPGEYERFLEYMDRQIQIGRAEEVLADLSYQRGMLSGGRWFRDVSSGEVWRLIAPDFPFCGTWERVAQQQRGE